MPRTVFVTQGEFADRYMRMEDDQADQAIADGWARENEADPEPDPNNPNPIGDPDAEVPDSLIEFENPPDPPSPEYAPENEATSAETGKEPVQRKKKSSHKRH
jgi:hypothetical protein